MFTLQGSNTYVVGKGPERILIDTAEGKPAYIDALGEHLASENSHITQILLTHWHPDHVGGLCDVLKAPFCKDPKVYKMSEPTHDERVFRGLSDFSTPDTTNLLDRISSIEHGDRFRTEGATIQAVHTPGHTTDHVCFLIEESNALMTGDTILGTGSSHFSDLTRYMESLELLLALSKECGGVSLLPSHGPIIPREEGTAKIAEYISHRNKREAEILACLQDAPAQTAMDITSQLYKDVPQKMWKAAETNVILHLLKLQTAGKVVKTGLVSNEGGQEVPPYPLGGRTPPAELMDIFSVVAPNLIVKWTLAMKSAM